MKANKRIALIFGASLLTLSATGCAHFPSFVPAELKDIEIVADPFKTFVKNDLFEECADLEIKGYYTNGKTKTLDKSNVELIYISNDTGVGYNINKEIPAAGDYYLKATYKGITSSKFYEFSAVQYHEYIDSIEINDAPEEMVFPTGVAQRITLNINPTEYTEKLAFRVQDSTIAKITKIDKNIFEIEGKKEGKTNICFSAVALIGKELLLKDWMFELIIGNVYVNYLIPTGPNKVTVGEKINISYIADPIGVNVPIEAYSTDESILTVDKINNYLFEVKGIKAGKAGIVLTGKKSPTTYYSTLAYQIEVEHVYVQEMKIDCPIFVGRGSTVELNLFVSPSNFTAPIYCFVNGASCVSVQKQTATKYIVTGLKNGEAEICFIAKSGSNSCAFASHKIEVGEVYITSISVDKHIRIRAGNTYTLNLSVTPSNYTNDINFYVYESDKHIISVEKISTTKYKITGVGNGDSTVFFESEQDEMGWNTSAYCDVTVLASVEQTMIPLHLSDFKESVCPPLSDSSDPIRILVIPVWLADSTDYYSEDDMGDMWDNIYDAYFASFTHSNFEFESVASFYEKESFGQCIITGTMSQWYVSDKKSSDLDSTKDVANIIKKATSAYFEEYPNTEKIYDHNDDGYMDVICGVYAYPAQGTDKIALWAYRSDISGTESNKEKPSPRTYTWASYDRMYAHANDSTKINAKCYIHEFGHAFGLKDYYDSKHLVDWSSCNMQSNDRGGHDPYSVMSIGWANPYIPRRSCTLTFRDFQSSGEFVILSPQWNFFNSPFDEYLVIELVGESGLNEYEFKNYYNLFDGVTDAHAGIRVYHVDSRLWNNSLNGYSNNPKTSDKFAFNNTCNPNAQILSEDNIALLHMIRKDPNVYDLLDTNKINYYSGKSLNKTDLFYVGDEFNYDLYKNQFFKWYENRRKYIETFSEPIDMDTQISMEANLDNYQRMNNGYKLGWSFEVTRIIEHLDGTYETTIVFTKN